MAWSVLDNARNAYGVFMQGGPHVIWGRGLACPDTIVQALLYDGTLPVAREQLCEQDPVGDYTPLTLTDPAQLADAFTVARAVETELLAYIPLAAWDGEGPTTFGCPQGGALTAIPTDQGTDFAFADCRFWPDLAFSGTGVELSTDSPADGITLTLGFTGSATGDLSYLHRTTDEAYSLTGSWNGQPAMLPRGLP
jgi:hypothetical protein